MNIEVLYAESKLQEGLLGIATYSRCLMEGGRAARPPMASRGRTVEYKRPKPHGTKRRSFPSGCFSAEAFLVLACLTVTLLILPLVLPPLPPPPTMLLLLPIGILLVLMILAFMPSDVRDIASSYF